MMNGEFELTMWVRVCWERGTRYYEAYVHQDLWGAWCSPDPGADGEPGWAGRCTCLAYPTRTRGIE